MGFECSGTRKSRSQRACSTSHTHYMLYMNIINKRAEKELEFNVNIFLHERLGQRLRDDESLGLCTDSAVCGVGSTITAAWRVESLRVDNNRGCVVLLLEIDLRSSESGSVIE